MGNACKFLQVSQLLFMRIVQEFLTFHKKSDILDIIAAVEAKLNFVEASPSLSSHLNAMKGSVSALTVRQDELEIVHCNQSFLSIC